LLSGGLDSSAIASWRRPEHCVFVDYGQRPARGEARSSAAVARALDLPLKTITVDLHDVGSGLMSRAPDGLAISPKVEWWPYRNQFLITLAAAYALKRGAEAVVIGTVREDGERFADGTQGFIELMIAVLGAQEGHINLIAPAARMTSADLITKSGIEDDVLGWTQSCHLSDLACGGCPGCRHRAEVLAACGRLQP
jgi:7-cyano-7-deazaguanine synthase